MRIKLSARQERDLRALTHGPRGGFLRGKNRPSEDEIEDALSHWPKIKRRWTIFWLILLGRVR
jgi:hypothetical protein